ncbi:MAG: phosphoribosyltransferase [Cyanobacteria bacterium P01_D01_bin.6]
MVMRFHDRTDAGRHLAQKLLDYAHRPDVWVFALPRGGVPVAYEIAIALGAPLEVCVVRKLGVPGQEELAMGAIAPGNICILNRGMIQALEIESVAIGQIAAQELQELKRRDRCYRGDRPFPDLKDQIVILVDDGIATGFTCRAAIAALKQHNPAQIIVATPVASTEAVISLKTQVDHVVSLLQPAPLRSISLWYDHFDQTHDRKVCDLLAQANAE